MVENVGGGGMVFCGVFGVWGIWGVPFAFFFKAAFTRSFLEQLSNLGPAWPTTAGVQTHPQEGRGLAGLPKISAQSKFPALDQQPWGTKEMHAWNNKFSGNFRQQNKPRNKKAKKDK